MTRQKLAMKPSLPVLLLIALSELDEQLAHIPPQDFCGRGPVRSAIRTHRDAYLRWSLT